MLLNKYSLLSNEIRASLADLRGMLSVFTTINLLRHNVCKRMPLRFFSFSPFTSRVCYSLQYNHSPDAI